MGYLDEFGFKVFRLRDAKAENEFLLYNKNSKNYATYSASRLVKILKDELKSMNINLRDFGQNELGLDYEKSDPIKLLYYWIEDETVLIHNEGFKPCKKLTYTENNKTYFNTFNFIDTFDADKYKLEKPMTFEELKEKAPYHYKLLSNLHNYDDEAIKNTLLKIADKLRYPYEKAQDCIVFYPGEGAGKGIFYKYIIHPIFQQYAKKILMKKLNNDFNGFLKTPLILVLEEGKRDMELVETLKEIITEGTLLINEKGKPQTEENIYFLVFVFSNHMNPIDLGKRRGSYHLTNSLGKNIDESQTIGAEICDNISGETNYLLQYLHNLEFTHQEAMRPFNTMAKILVNDLNKSPIEVFFDYLLSFDNIEAAFKDLHKRRTGQDFYSFNIEWFKPKKKDIEEEKYISKTAFKEAYNNFCILEGLRNNIIKHNKDIVQLWALFRVPEEAHQRIMVKSGENEGRKLDHIRLSDIEKIFEENNKEEEE